MLERLDRSRRLLLLPTRKIPRQMQRNIRIDARDELRQILDLLIRIVLMRDHQSRDLHMRLACRSFNKAFDRLEIAR